MSDDSIAIVGGTGDLGYGLALRWAKAGRDVYIGSRVAARAEEAAEKVRERVGKHARVMGLANEEAIQRAGIVVIAVPFSAQVSTITSIKEKLQIGQTVVDCTVPLEAAVGGAATRTLNLWAGSAAEQAARYLPPTVHTVAAFQNVPAPTLQELDHDVDCDVFVCSDNAEARARLKPWIEAISNCRYIDGGKLENARVVEALTAFLIGINRRYKTHSGIRVTGIAAGK